MTLQIIKSVDGKDEYVLLPVPIYRALKDEIEDELADFAKNGDYVPFDVADYVDNPVALARIRAHVTQEELAQRMDVSQAYISKIEQQKKVTTKLLQRVNEALKIKKSNNK